MSNLTKDMPLIREIKRYNGNKVKLAIDRKVVESEDEGLRDFYIDVMLKELKITRNKLSMVLNNSSELTLKDAAVIAQILEVDIADLIRYK